VGKKQLKSVRKMEKRMTILAIALGIVLAVSLSYNGYLHYTQRQNNSNHTFNFWWSAQEQNITSGNGIFWMNFTFKTVGENLSITVSANDDEETRGAALVMVFDRNRNGKIDYDVSDYGHPEIYGIVDTPYVFESDNKTSTPWILVGPKGEIIFISSGPGISEPSPWHTCTFSNETGYTFSISLSLEEIGPTGIVYAIFLDNDNPYIDYHHPFKYYPLESMEVYVEFSYLP
jgi:hypothetical protein